MVLFTVIIPHYNSTEYLKELLATIPVDDALQLIVVDDKSEESTDEVEQLVLARNGLFLHNTTDKKGAGVCRNLGLKEAKGKWLLFADADDYYVEGAFDLIKKYQDSDADIVYFEPTSKYRHTGTMAKRHIKYQKLIHNYQKKPAGENEVSLKYKFIVPWSKMVKNELVRKNEILFDEVPASNDVMFSIKCAYKANKIEAATGQIYCTMSGDGTLTTKYNEKNFWSRVQVFKERYTFLKEHLNVKEQKAFGFSTFSGMTMIFRALKQGYGLKMAGKIWKFFRNNKVKLIDFGSVKTSLNQVMTHKK